MFPQDIYWADNPAYEPDLATYMKVHYKPEPNLDPQKEVGFVPVPSDAPETSTEAEEATESRLTGIEERSDQQNLWIDSHVSTALNFADS